MRTFIESLPAELVGVDFRVLAPEGGYGEFVNDVLAENLPFLDVLAVHRGTEASSYVLLRVFIDLETVALNDATISFDHGASCILDQDGQPTHVYVSFALTIDLDVVRDGATAGSLRMFYLPSEHDLTPEGA
ncbi:MAG: hypothetical protein WBB39_03590 [Candidatus Saccharimonadales bacterium]